MTGVVAEDRENKLGPAVEPTTRVLRFTSVSAMERFDPRLDGGCKRKWYLRYVKRIKEEKKKWHDRGTAGHKEVDHFLSTGQDVLGAMMRAGKHLLPPPGPDLIVEKPFEMTRPIVVSAQRLALDVAGVPVTGKMDWLNPRGWYIDPNGQPQQDPDGTVEVGDNKTSADIAKWAKPGSELINTIQMPGYARVAMQLFPNLEYVRLSHVVFNSDPNKAWRAVKTTDLVPVAIVKKRFAEIEAVVEEMKEVARVEDDALKVEGNFNACGSYGGCQYGDAICFKHLTGIERLRMTLMSKVRNQTGAPAAQPPPQAPANGAQFSPPPAFAAPPIAGPPAMPASQPYVQQPQGQAFAPPLFQSPQQPGGPPPQWQQPQQAQAQVPQAAPPFQPPQQQQQAQQPATGNFAPPPPFAPPPNFQPQQQAQGPAAPVPPASAAPAGKKVSKRKAAAEPVGTVAPAIGGIRLFINCMPNAPFIHLDAYVQEVLGAIEEQFQVPDIRCAPDGNSPLAFGRWRGVLTSAVRAGLPIEGSYVVFSGNELTDAVVDAILPHLQVGAVVRGVR